MKRASWALAILVFTASAPCHAQLASGGAPTDFGSSIRTLLTEDFQPRGRVRLQLIVESGVFFFASSGHLRVYSHRYRYTLQNLDIAGGDENTIVLFSPTYCGAPPVNDPPAVVQGSSDPSTWTVRLRTDVPAPSVEWAARDPSRQGIPAESTWSFVLYTNAEPELSFLTIDGRYQPASGGAAEPTHASIMYWVPGCALTTSAAAPNLDWEKSADTAVSAAGRVISYTLRATVVGATAATTVVMVDPLPGALAYIPGTTTLNGAPLPDPVTGQPALANGLTLPLLAPGASALVRFQARVRAGQAGGTVIENTAVLTTAQTPPLTSPSARTTLLAPDTLAPVVTIASPRSIAYTKTETETPATLPLQFSVADADPGLDPASLKATLDGAPVQSGSALDLFGLRPGPHALRIQARDFAGNAADVVVNFTVVATFDSSMWEVSRLLKTGGIRLSRTATPLVQALAAAKQRKLVGDTAGARVSLQFFLATVTDPARRQPPLPLLSADAAAQLEATARYLLAQL